MVFAGQTAFAAALGQTAEIFRAGTDGIAALNTAAGIVLGESFRPKQSPRRLAMIAVLASTSKFLAQINKTPKVAAA
jgi:hypothetical protein